MEKFEENNRNNFIYLYKICDILVNARILRLNSDIRAFGIIGLDMMDKYIKMMI